jgi:hypothetical protein
MTDSADGRIFIAYDPQDSREAQELSASLEQAGFWVWVAGRDAAASTGEEAYAAMRSAAARCACSVLVLSGRAVNMGMLGDLTHLADQAGKPIFPIRVGPLAQVPNFPALARAKAWIDASGPAAGQELSRLTAELTALAPRRVPPSSQHPSQPQPQPQPAPAPAVAAVLPAAAAPPPAQPGAVPSYAAPVPPPLHYPAAYPSAAQAPAHGHPDWNSVELQPGEVSLGSWVLAINISGPDVTGSLTVTDRRILFKPKLAGTSLLGMLLSQRKQFKARHTIVLSRDQIVRVHSEKRLITTWIYVTTAGGAVCTFNRGVMSADPILAVLQPR